MPLVKEKSFTLLLLYYGSGRILGTCAGFPTKDVKVYFVHTFTLADELKVELLADSFLKSYQ